MTIRPGDEWGVPTESAPDLIVVGSDGDLSRALKAWPHPTPLLSFLPNTKSDLARSIGLTPSAGAFQNHSEKVGERLEVEDGGAGETKIGSRIAAPIDAIEYRFAGNKYLAMNAIEIGTSPLTLRASTRSKLVTVTVDGRKIFTGPATGILIANGQFIGAANLVPRGHPGDGRLEVHIYSLNAGERSAMRRRLATGTHLPHPRIKTASGASIRVEIIAGAWPIKADSETAGRAGRIEIEVLSPAARLLL